MGLKTIMGVCGLMFVMTFGGWAVEHEGPAPVHLPQMLTLEEALRIAVAGNPTLKAAAARVDQAQAVVDQAHSEYIPGLDSAMIASVTEVSNNDQDMAEIIDPGFDKTIENYQANLTASWLVFDGFGRKFRNALAQFSAQQSEASLAESKRLILNAVSSAYHNVQLARENITIAHADISFNERLLKESEARQEAGTGSLSDVLNFQIRIRAAQTSLLTAELSHRVTLIALVELMGVSHSTVPEGMDVAVLAPEMQEEMVLPEVDGLVEYALKARPDVHEAMFLVDQADAGIGLSRSQYYPSLVASASADAQRGDNSYYERDDVAGTLGLSLRYNIFSGGLRKAQVVESKAFRREADQILLSRELAAAADVREAIRNLDTSQRVLILQRETTQYVERNRELVEREYDAGQGSLVRLNEAQRDLISQRGVLALAQVALRQSWFNLRTATAEILKDTP